MGFLLIYFGWEKEAAVKNTCRDILRNTFIKYFYKYNFNWIPPDLSEGGVGHFAG